MKNIITIILFSFLLLQGCDSKQTSQVDDKSTEGVVSEVDSTEVMVDETMP